MKLSQYGFVIQNKDKPGQDMTIYPISALMNPDSIGALEFRRTTEDEMIQVGFNFFYKKINTTGSADTGKIQSKVLIRYTYE